MRTRDWMRCKDPIQMVRDIWWPKEFTSAIHERRLRLFTLHTMKRMIDECNRPAVTAAARIGWKLAEGFAAEDEITVAVESLRPVYYEAISQGDLAASSAVNVLGLLLGGDPGGAAYQVLHGAKSQEGFLTPSEFKNACWLLKEIFHEKGSTPTFDTSWRTPSVLALAHSIYTENTFDCLPILADALEDAGCDSKPILKHSRDTRPHVHGCWVVDLCRGVHE